MGSVKNKLSFLSSRIESHYKVPERKEFKVSNISFSEEEINKIVASLDNITSQEFETGRELLTDVASNLRFSSYESVGRVLRPSASLIKKVACAYLTNRGYVIQDFDGNITASRDHESLEISAADLGVAKQAYAETLKFKKVAAIIPDGRFVQHLAKKAFDILMRVKPKDVSKCLAGIIHTTFFDYAMDKNIFLTSNFYYELRSKYMKDIKANLGVNEIKYYASNERDRALLAAIDKFAGDPKKHSNIYKQAKSIYSELSDRNLCDRIITMAELVGFDDTTVIPLASSLSKETNLEFKFADA